MKKIIYLVILLIFYAECSEWSNPLKIANLNGATTLENIYFDPNNGIIHGLYTTNTYKQTVKYFQAYRNGSQANFADFNEKGVELQYGEIIPKDNKNLMVVLNGRNLTNYMNYIFYSYSTNNGMAWSPIMSIPRMIENVTLWRQIPVSTLFIQSSGRTFIFYMARNKQSDIAAEYQILYSTCPSGSLIFSREQLAFSTQNFTIRNIVAKDIVQNNRPVLYVFFLMSQKFENNHNLYFIKSINNGITWEMPVKVIENLYPKNILFYHRIMGNPDKNQIFVEFISSDPIYREFNNVNLIISEDNGKTWYQNTTLTHGIKIYQDYPYSPIISANLCKTTNSRKLFSLITINEGFLEYAVTDFDKNITTWPEKPFTESIGYRGSFLACGNGEIIAITNTWNSIYFSYNNLK